ncbi:MAG TPA: PA0069 family radical SAM protein [Steroidobacteraceae bacterium]|nr:PA0069 family radical SAM protein [Steroidobacteraceae bacterium]
MPSKPPPSGYKGRGALSNPANRFDRQHAESIDDGWFQEAVPSAIPTEVSADASRTIISSNDSPDIGFDQSINPYRGCEHGCVFCYARPTHAYLGMSPGIDFETRLTYKPEAAALLRQELARPGYVCKQIMLGSNTDPYQPIERQFRVTRAILEVLAETRHPVSITTRSTLILRDLDLLAPMAAQGLVSVVYSVTTFDQELKRRLEPRSASSPARLQAIRALRAEGVPVGVLAAPIIPAVNDSELETILQRVVDAGATHAGYVLLRLPLEVAELFRQWLDTHMPDRAAHVMSLVQDARGGKDNTSAFGERMRGTGAWAQLLRDRFRLACRKHGLATGRDVPLDVSQFRPPSRGGQMDLGI